MEILDSMISQAYIFNKDKKISTCFTLKERWTEKVLELLSYDSEAALYFLIVIVFLDQLYLKWKR